MKLQAKFTLHFIFIVFITIVISLFLIHWNLQSQFNRFIRERNQEQRISPLNQLARLARETPEQRFSHAVSSSLLWAGVIDILLAVILAYFLSNFLLQRIFQLKSAMQQYIKDGQSKAVLHAGDDEVDDLAKIYNLLIEKIEREERIRKDFFVDMSHELRTPMTSIKGYLEGLIDHVFDPEKEKDIHKKTLHETDRMIRLVKEMTTLAKLESEPLKLAKESVALKKLTRDVVEMLLPASEQRNMKIEIYGEATAELDPYKFKQILINLLDNAIHYGQEGTSIFIEMGQEQDKIYWRIKNKTENIDPQNLEYFFERFYRADKSRTYDSKKPHLGIGLNIAKKIVEQHGGSITARIEGDDIIFEIFLALW
jgi:signal transduction histidine kinase